MVHANLVSVNLSESDVSDVGLTALVVCRRLQKIDLNAMKGTRTNITYQGLHMYAFMDVCFTRSPLNLIDNLLSDELLVWLCKRLYVHVDVIHCMHNM